MDVKEKNSNTAADAAVKNGRRCLWMRFFKWTGAVVLAALLLSVAVISVAVWVLTPERLTPLVEEYAGKYLYADVKADRIELTFWSSFPRLDVEADNVSVVSRNPRLLDAGVRDVVPADVDSLLSVQRFSAGINLLGLCRGEIALYDIQLENPCVNLVQVNDSVANFDIVPPSEPDADDEPSAMMPVSVDRFAVIGAFPVHYRALADSVDVTVTVRDSHLIGKDNPLYELAFAGDAGAVMPVAVPDMPFSLNGKLRWDQAKPDELRVSDFTFGAGALNVGFNTLLVMGDTLCVRELDAHVPSVNVMDVMAMLPAQYRGDFEHLDTDLAADLKVKLLKPFAPMTDAVPDMDVVLELDASRLNYQQMHLTKVKSRISATVDGSDLDRSTITVEKLDVTGRAMDFKLEGVVTRPLSDPYIRASFDGGITFRNLPSKMLAQLPFELEGVLRGAADMRMSMSDLSPKRFHRVLVDGQLSLSDFRLNMRDSSMLSYIHSAQFNLGSRSKVDVGGRVVDSLLTASLKIDTVAFRGQGLNFTGRDLTLGAGSRNVASSADTSLINPVGAVIKARLITMRSDSDSMRVRLREASVRASLQRYNNDARSPLLKLDVDARNIRYSDRFNRASLRDGHADLTLHPKSRKPMSAAMKVRYDSIAALYPELSSDSILSLARIDARKNRKSVAADGRENMTFDLDNSLRSWLRLWQAEGSFTAARARVFTPYFPSRNTLTGVDLTFSTDSVLLRNTMLRVGKSDFMLNGAVRNLSRALTSRRGAPIEFDFDMVSDTIDINDITATMMRGAVFAEKIREGEAIAIADSENTDVIQASLDKEVSETERTAFVVPSNIKANMRVRAKRIYYNEMWLRRFEGVVSVFDGAINLDRLRARTDIGSLNFSALYSAPTAADMRFAAGMTINRLNLREFLDMMPQLDTIMPLLKEVEGIVNADMAITTELDSMMNLRMPTVNLAMKLSGDSLVLLDSETFRTVAKWMMFKQKERNMIDHMDVELTMHDGWLDLYPFVFDMDRYRIGVQGSNDAGLNLDYHVAVLKSPLPFKFGINIKGTPDDMKIRVGKARINEKTVASSRQVTDTVRVNLMNEIQRVFRRGVRTAGARGLKLQQQSVTRIADGGADDNISHADSLVLIQQGLLEAPAGFVMPDSTAVGSGTQNKKKSNKK